MTFAFDPIDITPPNGDGIITLERVPPEVVDFGVTEVRDPNLDDSLTYTFRFVVDGEEFAQQTLVAPIDRVRTEAEGETIYQPILQSFDPCLEEVANATQVIVELTLRDEIPPEQRDVVELRSAWESTVVWSVGFVQGPGCADDPQ